MAPIAVPMGGIAPKYDTEAIKKATTHAANYDIFAAYATFEREHPEYPSAKYPASVLLRRALC